MKIKAKEESIRLRLKGYSISKISKNLGVAKSSVSMWVRGVELSEKTRATLKSNSFTPEAINKRRVTRMENRKIRHNLLHLKAVKEAEALEKNQLWLLGTALYWGEGGKTQNIVRVANSDPAVIKTAVAYLQKVCLVPTSAIKVYLHIFEDSNEKSCIEFWSKVTGIPKQQFYRPYRKNSIAGSGLRQTLPYGTAEIYVLDTDLFLRIMGWVEYLRQKLWLN